MLTAYGALTSPDGDEMASSRRVVSPRQILLAPVRMSRQALSGARRLVGGCGHRSLPLTRGCFSHSSPITIVLCVSRIRSITTLHLPATRKLLAPPDATAQAMLRNTAS
jgi:hypothetical protein